MNNAELKFKAREKLASKGSEPKLFVVALYLISLVANYLSTKNFILSILISILLIPLTYGTSAYFLKTSRNEETSLNLISFGYEDFSRILTAGLWYRLYTFLWTLLFIIPGIIKSYSYSMYEFILYDNIHMDGNEALELSKNMMKGNKMRLFLLQLSFIGWALLSVLTFGILLIWLVPYMNTTMAMFYEDVKDKFSQENNI